MNDILFNVGYAHFLVLAAVLFLIGMLGVLIRRNALIILMSVELMLNAANMTLLAFSRMWGGAEALGAPDAIQLPPIKPGIPGELVDWGSTKAVGADLFGPGLFPFEAISILLLVAVVGAIAIARPVSDDPHAGEAPKTGGLP